MPFSDIFGGLTGKAAKGIRSRGSRIDAAVNAASKGQKKKKAVKRTTKKKR